jgi:hypothetical protein
MKRRQSSRSSNDDYFIPNESFGKLKYVLMIKVYIHKYLISKNFKDFELIKSIEVFEVELGYQDLDANGRSNFKN